MLKIAIGLLVPAIPGEDGGAPLLDLLHPPGDLLPLCGAVAAQITRPRVLPQPEEGPVAPKCPT